MVARGVGAAGPVLLACRQWDPRGLARRLPSLGAGAWRSAPLLPWRVKCPGRVCATLAAGSGGSDGYLVSRFPLPAPRVLRCVWRAVPSGCPLPSLAGMPFHAVCAFRGLEPVALLVFPACPLCVCAPALPWRPPPPLPWLVWRAHLARSRCWALVGPFHAVRAPPRVLPRSRALFGLLGRGGGSPVSPLPGLGLCAPVGRFCASGAPVGVGLGGGGLCAVPPEFGAGGACGMGVRLASVCSSAFPAQATKRVSLASLWPWRAWLPYRSRSCSFAVSGRGPCSALARWRGFACSSWFLRERAAWGVAAGPALASLSGAAVLPGGRGDHPLCLGGVGAGAPAACGPVEGVGPWPPCSLSGGGGVRLPTQPPFRRQRIPPWRTRSVGVVGQPRAPGAACRRRASLAGGGGLGGEAARVPPPPEAPTDPARPSALPERATLRASLAMFWSWGRGPHTCPVRRRVPPLGVARTSFWRAGTGSPARCGGGRGGARPADAAVSPPGRHGPFSGRGDVPSALGGAEGRRPRGPQAGGGAGGRGGGGGGAPRYPAPLPRGVACGPRPCHPSSPARPPGVYTCSPGCWAAVGAKRGPVGRRWVSVAGEGGGRSPCPGPLPRPPQASFRVGCFVCAFLGAAIPLPVGSG